MLYGRLPTIQHMGGLKPRSARNEAARMSTWSPHVELVHKTKSPLITGYLLIDVVKHSQKLSPRSPSTYVPRKILIDISLVGVVWGQSDNSFYCKDTTVCDCKIEDICLLYSLSQAGRRMRETNGELIASLKDYFLSIAKQQSWCCCVTLPASNPHSLARFLSIQTSKLDRFI